MVVAAYDAVRKRDTPCTMLDGVVADVFIMAHVDGVAARKDGRVLFVVTRWPLIRGVVVGGASADLHQVSGLDFIVSGRRFGSRRAEGDDIFDVRDLRDLRFVNCDARFQSFDVGNDANIFIDGGGLCLHRDDHHPQHSQNGDPDSHGFLLCEMDNEISMGPSHRVSDLLISALLSDLQEVNVQGFVYNYSRV